MELRFAGRDPVIANVMIGADGVRSVIRDFVTGGRAALYSATSAVRGIAPVDRLPSLPDPQAIQFWMGKTLTCFITQLGVTARRSISSLLLSDLTSG